MSNQMKAKLYNIYWTDCYGKTDLLATTDTYIYEDNQ